MQRSMNSKGHDLWLLAKETTLGEFIWPDSLAKAMENLREDMHSPQMLGI